MRSIRQHNFIFFCACIMVSQVAFGVTQFRILTGTKTQSFNAGSANQIGSSPLGLITFVDFEVSKKIYLSFGTSFEMSTETYSTSGFSIYGSGMYYIYGLPKAVNSTTGNMNMDFFYPYSIYLSGGVFQKQIKVKSATTGETTDEDLGGLKVGFGLNYNLNARMYVASHVQMLMSGTGTSSEFSSTEFYIGLGLRL